MLCSQAIVVKRQGSTVRAAVLYCRSWTCEICRPKRQQQLIAEGIHGQPNRFLTLTIRAGDPASRNARCKQLVEAWRQLRLEIHDELLLPLRDRWKLKDGKPDTTRRAAILAAKKATPKQKRKTVEFLAVVEAQKSGEPHLHILIRSEYLPQPWISERMSDICNSPICWIEIMDGKKKIANYVAKYCGKDPHRFGSCKRYWQSRKFNLTPMSVQDNDQAEDAIVTIVETDLDTWRKQQELLGASLRSEGRWIVADLPIPTIDQFTKWVERLRPKPETG